MKKSIITDSLEYCYVCSKHYPQIHHVIFGPNRKHSDKYGLILPLCLEHHTGNNGPHQNREVDLKYKELAEKAFLKHYGTKEDFIKIFGKSYI